MRDELISFQQTAVSKLLAEINSAQAYHRVDGRPQPVQKIQMVLFQEV